MKLPADRRLGPLRLSTWAAAALLLLFAIRADLSISDKGTTYDEIAHFAGGFGQLAYGDFRLQPENGVLPQKLGALPAYASGAAFPPETDPAWEAADVWSVGWQTFYTLGNDLEALLRGGRRAILALTLLLGALVFGWSRSLWGPAGGLLSLALYTFSPNILAHGRLITSDMAATLCFTAAVGALWLALKRVTPVTLLLAGAASTLLAVAKFSAVLLGPIALLLAAIRALDPTPMVVELGGRRGRRTVSGFAGRAAVSLAVAVAAGGMTVAGIWLVYGLRYDSVLGEGGAYSWEVLLSRGGLIDAVVGVARDNELLPEPFLYGFSFVNYRATGRPSYLLGEVYTGAKLIFFPVCFLTKTPLVTLATLAGAGVMAARAAREAVAPGTAVRQQLIRLAPLWVFLLVYVGAALVRGLNIGHRHLLPTLPALFILAGSLAVTLKAQKPLVLGGIGLALLLETAAIHPHYLSFFNQASGGPEGGHKVLVDSSLDWGQDLPLLAQEVQARRATGEVDAVYLSYFGFGFPEHYGLEVTRIAGFGAWQIPQTVSPLGPGLYAVSATTLVNVYARKDDRGDWSAVKEVRYRALQAEVTLPGRGDDPAVNAFSRLRIARLTDYLRSRGYDGQVGYSILLYELDAAEVTAAIDGPWPWVR